MQPQVEYIKSLKDIVKSDSFKGTKVSTVVRKEINKLSLELEEIFSISPQEIDAILAEVMKDIETGDSPNDSEHIPNPNQFLEEEFNNPSDTGTLDKMLESNPEYIELHRLAKTMSEEELKEVLNFAKYTKLKGKDRGPEDDDDF
jgi:hypothetical protein